MKFHSGAIRPKTDSQMAAMIDVVFLLLIFFMLTLKVVPPEGDHLIRMPLDGISDDQTPPVIASLKVTLKAAPDGSLAEIRFGAVTIPVDANNPEVAFAALNNRVGTTLGVTRGLPLSKDAEVEIDADFHLDYGYTLQAVSAVMGRSEGAKVVRYVERVKFAPPSRA